MNLINLNVNHKVFGSGVVIDSTENSLTVQFSSKTAKFTYPDAFESYLVAEDVDVQKAIESEIAAVKQKAEEKRIAAEEAERIRKEQLRQAELGTSTKKRIEDGFGPDYHVKFLANRPVFTYQQVEKKFGIKISGFGRGINITPLSVVLISSVDKKKSGFVYHDRWTDNGDYIYSGEGKTGDQTLTAGNKAIVDADKDGKQIHLFVKFSPEEYYYQGLFSLVDYSYENDKDEAGTIRKELKFRLKKLAVA